MWQADSLIKDLAGYMVEATPETGEKTDRARPFAAQVNRGHVTMIDGDWNAAYREELRAFPNGKYKDQVDASLARVHRPWLRSIASPCVFSKELLDAIGPPEPPRPPPTPPHRKPTSAPNDARIEQALNERGVILFADPTPGVRLAEKR